MPFKDPYNKFINGEYKNKIQRDDLLHEIIEDCEHYMPLMIESKEKSSIRESIRNRILQLNENDDNFEEQYNSLYNNFEKAREEEDEIKKTEKIEFMKYKIGLLQKKSKLDVIRKEIDYFQKSKSILVLKSSQLAFYINIIQISIILVSAIITFFESIKTVIVLNSILATIVPIVASTYIALILSMARFFKLDSRKEELGNVIEKYGFIISRLKSKKRTMTNFDFKNKEISKWQLLLENYDKDGIEDIITKTTEEANILVTLKEYVYYQNIFFKLKLQRALQNFNQTKIPDKENMQNYLELGNLNKYKRKKCNNYLCKSICGWCCKTTIDYREIYDKLIQLEKIKGETEKMEENIHKSIIIKDDAINSIGEKKNSNLFNDDVVMNCYKWDNNIKLDIKDFRRSSINNAILLKQKKNLTKKKISVNESSKKTVLPIKNENEKIETSSILSDPEKKKEI